MDNQLLELLPVRVIGTNIERIRSAVKSMKLGCGNESSMVGALESYEFLRRRGLSAERIVALADVTKLDVLEMKAKLNVSLYA
ncbi:hypothetical protein ACPV37_07140 [Vibrio mediterranei]